MSEEFTSIGELAKQLDMSQRTIRYYEEIGLSEFRSTCVDNASLTQIRIEDGETRIEAINDSSHLKESPAT
jgi:broad specificity phosphatase PhoE